jgi:hypothetical protein
MDSWYDFQYQGANSPMEARLDFTNHMLDNDKSLHTLNEACVAQLWNNGIIQPRI